MLKSVCICCGYFFLFGSSLLLQLDDNCSAVLPDHTLALFASLVERFACPKFAAQMKKLFSKHGKVLGQVWSTVTHCESDKATQGCAAAVFWLAATSKLDLLSPTECLLPNTLTAHLFS